MSWLSAIAIGLTLLAVLFIADTDDDARGPHAFRWTLGAIVITTVSLVVDALS